MENSNEFFFFLSKQHCGKARGGCYLGILAMLGLSPDRSLTGSFRFSTYGDEKTEPNGRARVEKEAGVPFSEQKSIFIITGHLMTEMYFLSPRV